MAPKNQFPYLQIVVDEITTADPAALREVRVSGRLPLPKSYQDFARQFGYGKFGSIILIYVPMEGEDSLLIRREILRHVFDDGLAATLWEFEPDGSPELVQRLEPFGISENGHIFAWDPMERTAEEEFAIYAIGSKLLAVRRAADNLYDFIGRCLDDRVKAMLGPGYKPLPATFKPLKPQPDSGSDR